MINHPTFRLHFMVFLWGFTGVVGKLISITSFPLVFYRMFLASIIFLILLKVQKKSIRIDKIKIIQMFGVGVIIAVHWLTFFQSIKVSNLSIALSTLSTGAVFTSLLEPLFFKRKVFFYELVLGLIIVVCMTMIFKVSPEYIWGIVLGIICSFLSALFSVLNAKLQPNNDSTVMGFYEMLGGTIITLLIVAYLDISMISKIPINDFLWLIVLAGPLTVYPMVESINLMKYISPFTLVLTVNLEPVYGIILGLLIFKDDEHMSSTFYIATLIMLLSVVLNGVIKRKMKLAS